MSYLSKASAIRMCVFCFSVPTFPHHYFQIWNDKGKHGPDQASLWSITHDDSTVDIDSFKAFAGREKQSIGVWKLKADEVEMVE